MQDPKERTHELIGLGGLVKKAGIENLDRAVLLGLLIKARELYDSYSESERRALFNIGSKAFGDRKKPVDTKPQNTIKESNKFYRKDDLEPWMTQ